MERGRIDVAGVISAVLAVLNATGLIVSVSYFLFVRHQFIAIFEDLDADLPAGTRFILNSPGSLWILISLLLLVALIAKEFLRHKWVTLVLNGVFLVGGFVCWAVFVAFLVLPWMRLIHSLS